jgi:hypothetical protein
MLQECRILNWLSPVGDDPLNHFVAATMPVVAKRAAEEVPYLLINELVASALGSYLRLPIPPCSVSRDENGNLWLISLDFSLTGERLPPANPRLIVDDFPELAAGIIVFDVLIANPDRHVHNIAAVHTEPKRLHIFDHEQALLGFAHDYGTKRLQDAGGEFVIDGCALGGTGHCLRTSLKDTGPIVEWLTRVESLPRWYIAEAIDDARRYADITDREADALKKFLVQRKDVVRGLLRQAESLGAFPAVTTERGLF